MCFFLLLLSTSSAFFHTGNVWFLSNKGEKLALSVTFSGAEAIKLIRDVNTDTVDKVWGGDWRDGTLLGLSLVGK